MNWLLKTLSSSIGQKIIMALTGLFLCLFLVIHLIGNFQLLKDDQGYSFNAYTKFMTSNPLIKIAGYITYLAILLHAFKGLHLVYKNRKARPKNYRSYNGGANSTWTSRSMGILGTVILVFIVIHMQQFWYEYKFTESVGSASYIVYETEKEGEKVLTEKQLTEMQDAIGAIAPKYEATNDEVGFKNDPVYKSYEPVLNDLEYAKTNGKIKKENYKDLYAVVAFTYTELWWVLLYVVSMFAISFHLIHGFASAFQSMGWNHSKYNGLIKTVGIAYSILIPAGFASIPIIMFLG